MRPEIKCLPSCCGHRFEFGLLSRSSLSSCFPCSSYFSLLAFGFLLRALLFIWVFRLGFSIALSVILEDGFIDLVLAPAWIGKFANFSSSELRSHPKAVRASVRLSFQAELSSNPLLRFLFTFPPTWFPISITMGTNATGGTTTVKGLYANSVFAHNHYAVGGVKALSTFVLGSSISTSVSNWRVLPPQGFLLAAHPWAFPSGSSSRTLVTPTRRHFLPRFAACGPVSRLGPLSLLHWVFLPCPARRSSWCMASGADGCVSRLRPCSSFSIVFGTSSFLFTCTTGSRGTGAAGRVSQLCSRTSWWTPVGRSTGSLRTWQ